MSEKDPLRQKAVRITYQWVRALRDERKLATALKAGYLIYKEIPMSNRPLSCVAQGTMANHPANVGGAGPSRAVPPPYCGPIEVFEPSVVAETYRFRAEVWQGEGFSVNPYPDNHASHARHWIVTRGETLVGAARLCMHNTVDETPGYEDIRHLNVSTSQPFAFLSHLVVCPSARNQGLGKLLDSVRVEAARAAGVNLILGRFYEYRVRGLVALGFRPVAEFRNQKIGNRRVLVMELRLAG